MELVYTTFILIHIHKREWKNKMKQIYHREEKQQNMNLNKKKAIETY